MQLQYWYRLILHCMKCSSNTDIDWFYIAWNAAPILISTDSTLHEMQLQYWYRLILHRMKCMTCSQILLTCDPQYFQGRIHLNSYNFWSFDMTRQENGANVSLYLYLTFVTSNVNLRFTLLATRPNFGSSDFIGLFTGHSEMTLNGIPSDPHSRVNSLDQILMTLICTEIRIETWNNMCHIWDGVRKKRTEKAPMPQTKPCLSLGICLVIVSSVFTLSMKRPMVLGYPKSAELQIKLSRSLVWSDSMMGSLVYYMPAHMVI